MSSLREYLRDYFSRPFVRPWALSAPIIVLLICLPMLRPLRHPTDLSDDESLRLATIHALVERGTLAIDPTLPVAATENQVIVVDGKIYADQTPMMALLLSGPAWVMTRLGWPLHENASLVAFVMTLLGATLPVALAAGLFYRMGRLFELPRTWRAGLAAAIVFGSGLITYAVVLNPHAPAAVLVLCAAACLIHVSLSKLPKRGVGWILLAGICAALAATIDPPAGIIAILFFIAIATLRMPIGYRVLGMLLFIVGLAGPIAVHVAYSQPIYGAFGGEIIPGWRHADATLATHSSLAQMPILGEPDADDIIGRPSRWIAIGGYAQWLFEALAGQHGIFSHFPVLLIGILGIAAVMHRHWPMFVKALAAASAIGAVAIISLYAAVRSDWREAMFATRWFILFLPLLMFWSGAWLRRSHSRSSWALAGTLLAFSIFVAIIGMTEPYPPAGYDRYTARQAMERLWNGPDHDALAGNPTAPVSR
ncbi:MAG: hypothetical protein H7Z14_03135 [Anaerolineae bacterium]|nr:hypothetical protein [Phycisphaerae bacterium]